MKYISTRGVAPEQDFSGALLTGLANDGGLYVPDKWPSMAKEGSGNYLETALEVMTPFMTDLLDPQALSEMIKNSYEVFDVDEVAPIIELNEEIYLMELFHGPTLAFKDVALQLVGRLFDSELSRQGKHLTIVGATSGDTGSAAIEACRDRDNLDIIILHPAGRVSEVQRRQMTTVDSFNVHNVAIEGTFDDCQDLVKAMFNDIAFRDKLKLGAVNSINWARVMAQIVYYFVASERLNGRDSPTIFSVPTGNFGNIFAGHAARNCGLNIPKLIVASNRNDILTRFFQTGKMEISQVMPTLSPSMDIQVSSNLERLLFELLDRDGEKVVGLFKEFRAQGKTNISSELKNRLAKNWASYRFDDKQIIDCIAEEYKKHSVVLDPHSALGVLAARLYRSEGIDDAVPIVSLSTAHPAKFPIAVEKALGHCPPLPEHLSDLFERAEIMTRLPNDLKKVKKFVTQCSRKI